VKSLAETRAALRKEIGPPTDRDENWQPMVSAGEVRQLLDALDLRDLMEEPMTPTGQPTVIYPQPTDVWVCLRSGNHNVTAMAFNPDDLPPTQRAIIRGLLQAALEAMEA
jgi:hypothetical protein